MSVNSSNYYYYFFKDVKGFFLFIPQIATYDTFYTGKETWPGRIR